MGRRFNPEITSDREAYCEREYHKALNQRQLLDWNECMSDK